jgi:hypothetical protein
MKKRFLFLFTIVIFVLLSNQSCQSFIKKNDYERVNHSGIRYDDTTLFAEKSPYLMPYNRVIDGVGTSINFGSPDVENHSLDIAMIPQSRLVVVEDRYGIAVFDVDKTELVSRLSFTETPQYKNALSSFSGIKAVVFKDSTYIFWGAGVREKSDSYVMQAVWDGQKLRLVQAFPFKALPPATLALPNEVSVQEENGDLFLYTVLNGNNQIAKVKVSNQEVVWTAPTGVAPLGLNVVGDKAFVTNWAGPLTNPTDGFETAGVPWGSAYINPKTGAISRGTVSVFDIKTGQLTTEINVGLHPNAVISSPDKQFVYVANGNSDYISVISTQSLSVSVKMILKAVGTT